jgi:hypothetical protein
MCDIASCNRSPTRYSRLCSSHRAHQRRFGHPEQQPLRAAHLNHYRRMVSKLLLGTRGVAVYAAFDPIWQAFIDECVAPLRRWEAGQACVKHHVEAAAQIEGLRGSGDPKRFLVTMTALFMLHLREPRYFKSDDAFFVTFQRVVRREGSGSYDLVWNATEARYARKLRGLPKKVAITLGRWITDAFSGSCGTLAHQMITEEDAPQERKRLFNDALQDLKDAWRAKPLPPKPTNDLTQKETNQ